MGAPHCGDIDNYCLLQEKHLDVVLNLIMKKATTT